MIMKTYVLTVSRVFPKTHSRSGQQTWFVEQINEALIPVTTEPILGKKLHTIRANYPLWENRIKEVSEGKAILSLRYWSGKPYNSKQVEFMQLNKFSGIGVQMLEFILNSVNLPFIDNFDKNMSMTSEQGVEIAKYLSKNDGLSFEDFKEWFKFDKHKYSEPMAIIHFTNFRY
jgi:hypothetical protein